MEIWEKSYELWEHSQPTLGKNDSVGLIYSIWLLAITDWYTIFINTTQTEWLGRGSVTNFTIKREIMHHITYVHKQYYIHKQVTYKSIFSFSGCKITMQAFKNRHFPTYLTQFQLLSVWEKRRKYLVSNLTSCVEIYFVFCNNQTLK